MTYKIFDKWFKKQFGILPNHKKLEKLMEKSQSLRAKLSIINNEINKLEFVQMSYHSAEMTFKFAEKYPCKENRG
ncbi:MAG: hypothetical protein KAJ48_00075 [Elusimicrobiales bacterium]|nr:hypothetical protein [Elusimicrobiales bacterium]